MYRKKFKPPLLKPRVPSTDNKPDDLEQPEAKRQKLDDAESIGATVEPTTETRRIPSLKPSGYRKPLLTLKNPATATITSSTPTSSSASDINPNEGFYNVLWRKYTNKKHKTFDGDGVLAVSDGYAVLKDETGKELGRTVCNKALQPLDMLSIGGKEVEIESIIPRDEFMAGRPFLAKATAATINKPTTPFINPARAVPKKSFKTPLIGNTVVPRKPGNEPTPRHDPNAENALVMTTPPPGYTKKETVAVVVDPFISQHLRPHQREGVKFLYDCVMGLKDYPGVGAILADEMGLGKTLQTIALLWTLFKQNPVWDSGPAIKKALIVCPVTLMQNWKKEFKKWLGNERIGVFVADGKSNIRDYTAGKIYQVMIVGYERLQKIQDELSKIDIDIVIADEGHRLKTENNKAAQAILSLKTDRRIILSGTPLQNDLREFFVMVDFVNPGLLGTYNSFKREFEGPIIRSRQPEATKTEKEKGEGRSQELSRLTNMFILRRTSSILAKYLPPKTEYVIFIKPSKLQVQLYQQILASCSLQAINNPQMSLQLITILKKLCNSPALLAPNNVPSQDEDDDTPTSILPTQLDPSTLTRSAVSASSKFTFLDRLLHTLSKTTDEKVILVSHYTATLTLLSKLLHARSLPHLRLDGSTPTNQRQSLVDTFNTTPPTTYFAFLLSSKAGGVGLNLIGASRLILIDSDWNPAIDLQAMARVHRDGQKREVRIYRLVTKGCLDEKIFMRQVVKTDLAERMLDGRGGREQAFSREELRRLFSVDEAECSSETEVGAHKGLGCSCRGRGTENRQEESDSEEEELEERPGLVKASQVKPEEVKEGRKKGLKALMGWRHVSGYNARECAVDPGEEEEEVVAEDGVVVKRERDERLRVELGDEVLRRVVRDGRSGVGYLFIRRSE
ncbi:hypothetical protein BJ508DRAFT_417549 [Ascobolus immersus RN42]|uniref:Uncharacterized protein n=1 Tax=Ascobolus immersus RN42 TaxID=1160509 RepID=A0A3N4HRV1_ASCIM|nr:hypothetical protein BJ508DRAFT_417549 [Ascobolus immersus RN42]